MGILNFTPETKTMADFRSFQAWRYSPEKVKLTEALAPPYDIITTEGRRRLYARSSSNCVRLDFNQPEAGDHDRNNPYTRARDIFQNWKKEGILIQDETPSFYLYRQGFQDPVKGSRKMRSALLGRLKLESFESGVVIPHEKTLAKPKEDRRRLLEAAQANFSPVFGLVEDASGVLRSNCEKAAGRSRLLEAADEEGVRHELWAIQAAEDAEAIRGELSEKKIYIADGHHRYQTAVDYARDMRTSLGLAEDEERPFDFVLTALAAFEDPGLLLLPTHRIVLPFEGWNAESALESLKEYFKVEPIVYLHPSPLPAKGRGQGEGIPLCLKDKFYLLTLRDPSKIRRAMSPGKPEIWYTLDVNLVGDLILERLWHLPESRWESTLRFTQSRDEAIEQVSRGKALAAFLLNAPPVSILRGMGERRELMPQKSTYFYPKLASGLVFYSHE